MVIIAIPQLVVVHAEAVAVAGGGGAAVAAGVDADDVDDIEDPPPHALKASSETHATAGNQRR